VSRTESSGRLLARTTIGYWLASLELPRGRWIPGCIADRVELGPNQLVVGQDHSQELVL
jgi:hypothetical protein